MFSCNLFLIRSFTPLSNTVPGVTSGLVNYWPVKSGVIADLVGLVSTISAGTPQFTTDRFGNANDAILVNDTNTNWNSANRVYLFDDFTITAWVKNLECTGFNYIGLS
jgi:hypothetical protein